MISADGPSEGHFQAEDLTLPKLTQAASDGLFRELFDLPHDRTVPAQRALTEKETTA
ncbi:hypothetical protein ABZ766_15730 [Streptomyces sp. NPDC006670]|uniref:hypothetical protein n=1 Tax=Streptomyces sp. NPDC006670 TaxID=3154476 RepID=UPI003411B396